MRARSSGGEKEKRSIGDSRQKTEEDIQSSEDKCNHFSKVKGKLEQSLDECEDGLICKDLQDENGEWYMACGEMDQILGMEGDQCLQFDPIT